MRKKVRLRSTILTLLILVLCAGLLWQFVFKERYMKLAYPEKYASYIREYAAENGLDPYLVFAVTRTESSFNPRAVSNIGARGLMQLTPDTFAWAQSKTPQNESLSKEQLFDPETNICYGTVVLSALLREFGREDTTLAAYHAGRGNVKKWLLDTRYSHDGRTLYHIPFADTRAYVKRVLATKAIYQQVYSK